MSFRDLIQDVFRTLWAHRVRTLLTMFGIAWGVVSIVLMVAAGDGMRVRQAKQAETLGSQRASSSLPPTRKPSRCLAAKSFAR